MKMDENGWKWTKMDENGLKWMKVNKSGGKERDCAVLNSTMGAVEQCKKWGFSLRLWLPDQSSTAPNFDKGKFSYSTAPPVPPGLCCLTLLCGSSGAV